MTEGQRYRITWKHPKARRRRSAEGVYLGVRGDRYALECRGNRVVLVDRTHSVRWLSLAAAL